MKSSLADKQKIMQKINEMKTFSRSRKDIVEKQLSEAASIIEKCNGQALNIDTRQFNQIQCYSRPPEKIAYAMKLLYYLLKN